MIKPDNQNIEIRLLEERDRQFWIQEIGFNEEGGTFCFSLWTTLADALTGQRGEFFTTLPISPLAYRLENSPNQAKVICQSAASLIIFDDWGTLHGFTTDEAIVSAVVEEARKYQLLEQEL